MDAVAIQTKINSGYAKAASYVGKTYSHYRPTAGQPPIGSATLIGVIIAAFTVKGVGFNFDKPGGAKDFYWNCLADGSLLQPGDVLVSSAQTFAIAAMQPLLPPIAVLSNDRIAVSRQISEIAGAGGSASAPPSQVGGSIPYFGDRNKQTGGEAAIVANVPCAIAALGARALDSKDGLPSSSPGPVRWKFLIAAGVVPQGTINDRDVITDQLGSRYVVSQNYWGPLGYEVEAVREEA